MAELSSLWAGETRALSHRPSALRPICYREALWPSSASLTSLCIRSSLTWGSSGVSTWTIWGLKGGATDTYAGPTSMNWSFVGQTGVDVG